MSIRIGFVRAFLLALAHFSLAMVADPGIAPAAASEAGEPEVDGGTGIADGDALSAVGPSPGQRVRERVSALFRDGGVDALQEPAITSSTSACRNRSPNGAGGSASVTTART
jgi:hypothetical protein